MLEVIGAGFGRTGTHSLGLALEKLGFGPCYNLHEVARNPDHRETWNNAMDGKSIDWVSFFSSYKSAVEWPSVTFFDEIIQQFPDALVILTDAYTWKLLRRDMGRSVAESAEILTAMIKRVISGSEQPTA